ncbi:retrovirus-related pol polyprotein from transposon TNT 1-94, partial [Tanacetum coccineum]
MYVEEDTRSIHEYLNDLEEEYQVKALLVKSKRFFKKGTQRFSSAKATDQTECHKCGKKGRFARDCWSKTSVPLYQSPFQSKSLSSSQHKPKLRPTKDFEAKYNKDEEEMSSDDNEMVEVKVLMALAKDNDVVSKEGARNGKWVKISMRKHVNTDILKENKNLRTELKELKAITETWLNSSNKVNQILPAESQRNIIDPSVVVTNSSAIDYDSADESLVCRTPLPPLKKLDGAEPISGPKTIKLILRSKSTFKAEALKVWVELLQDLKSQDHQNASFYLAHTGLSIRKRRSIKKSSTYFKKDVKFVVAQLIPQLITMILNGLKEVKHSSQKAEESKFNRVISSNANSQKKKTPTRRRWTGCQSYLHKYVEQSGPKVVFRDDSICTTKGYGSIKCNGIVFTKVAFVNGLKYNLISISQLSWMLKIVYVLDMTSSAQEPCFFAKASKNLNWIWHKRLAHLNFKTINKLAKQNFFIGLPSLVYSKDKPCSSCEKEKHHRASFKTKQTSSIKKCLHLLHMDLFGPVTPRSINHKKYTLVIVDEYLRSTIVKRHLKTPYEIFHKRIPNINFLHVFGFLVYIHNHKDYLGKFDEKVDDGYLLGYSLISKAFRVFNTRRQQTEETYHITFDESPDAIKFSKPSVDNINIAETERYPPNKYLYPYEPSQRYQTNTNDVYFIEPYEYPKPVVLETKVSSDQNGQTNQDDHNDQNDQSFQNDEILNDDHSEHSNHTNDEQIIDNLPNTKDIQISEHLSTPSIKDTSTQNTIPIPTPPLPIPSMVTQAPQDKWSQVKHIELVNIIGNLRAGMLTRAMAKQLSAASAHE